VGASDEVGEQLRTIWADSRPEIEERVTAIEQATIGLLSGTLSDEDRHAAEREAHKLAGLAGTFGFSRASDLAREAEGILDVNHRATPDDLVRLSAVAIRLRHQLLAEARPEGEDGHTTADPGAVRVTSAQPDIDVVIVDDDLTLVHLLRHALESRGMSVRAIHDGATAIEELAGNPPRFRGRVIILDVALPEQDGLVVLRALARDGVTRSSRVIVLTARSLESEVIQALDLGAFDHMAKPFSLPVLMHHIRRALDDRPPS